MIKYIFILLFEVLSLYSQQRYMLEADSLLHYTMIEVANSQIGVQELTGNNDGKEIDEYQKLFNLKKQNYCAMGIYWSWWTACSKVGISIMYIPIKKTAVAFQVFADAKKRGKKVKFGASIGDQLVWKYPDTWKGHTELISNVGKNGNVTTVAFNSSGVGSQRNGKGVAQKKRNIHHPLGRMQLKGIVTFNYKRSDIL